MTRLTFLFLAMAALAAAACAEPAPPIDSEVCVYGGTPSGVMAAVAAARHGHTVALVDINAHTGGVVSGGLVVTDMGDRKTVGGLADEFFLRIVRHYREKFGDDPPQLKACRNGYTFEPHVAEAVFDAMLAEQPRVRVFHRLRYRSVKMEDDKVTGGQGDKVKEGQAASVTPSPRHLVTPSPCHPVTPSPCHPITPSPHHPALHR